MTSAIHAWLELEHRILKARRPVEAEFAAINLAHTLVAYRQAVLWDQGVVALSGATNVEANAPYVLWLDKIILHLHPDRPTLVDATALPAGLAEQWSDWLPAHGLVLPCGSAILLFASDEPFEDGDIALLERLADLVGMVRAALTPKRRKHPVRTAAR